MLTICCTTSPLKEHVHEILSFISKQHTDFKSEVLGEIAKGTPVLDEYLKLKTIVKEDIPKLRDMLPVSAEMCASWKGDGWRLSVSSTGILYVAEGKMLKLFDISGVEKGHFQVDHDILRVLLIDDGDKDMLVLGTMDGGKIELRDTIDPSLVLDNSRSIWGIAGCQTSPK